MKHIIIILSLFVFCGSIYAECSFKPEEYYNFILEPAFEQGFQITLAKTGNEYKLTYGWIKADGTIKLDSSRIITTEEWNGFIELLERVKFWEAPGKVPPKDITDGNWWHLTGYINGKKHTLSRHSPDKYNLVYEAGEYLIKLYGNDYMKEFLKK